MLNRDDLMRSAESGKRNCANYGRRKSVREGKESAGYRNSGRDWKDSVESVKKPSGELGCTGPSTTI